MPWYLKVALRQLFPQRRWVSFFGVLSVIGVMLGVAVLIIVQSVMNGFGDELRSSISSSNGDIRIQSGGPIDDWGKAEQLVRSQPEVVAVEPFVQGVVLMQFDERPSFPGIIGIDPEHGGTVLPIEKFLIEGSFDYLDDGTILVGSSLAGELGLAVGSYVEIYTPLLLNKLEQDEILLPREMMVGGIFRSGWEEVDSQLIVSTLRVMQELYGFGNSIGGLMVRLSDRELAPEIAWQLDRELEPPLRAISWLEMNRDFLFVLQLEKSMMTFIMLFILIVAAFAISISLMMSVVRKTREIGLYSAMGATRTGVALAFCLQGFVIGVVGSVFGLGLAFVALENRAAIIKTFTEITESEAAIRTYYMFAEIPVSYDAGDIVTITLFSVILATVGGLIPAIRAAMLDPAEALRSE